jgi:hypothetical protein
MAKASPSFKYAELKEILAKKWYAGGEQYVLKLRRQAKLQRSLKTWFWVTYVSGLMVDGDAKRHFNKLRNHPQRRTLFRFDKIVSQYPTAQARVDFFTRLLGPISRDGIGHRRGYAVDKNGKEGPVLSAFISMTERIIENYQGDPTLLGNELLGKSSYQDQKTHLRSLPRMKNKNSANFMMMLLLNGAEDDVAIDYRLRRIADLVSRDLGQTFPSYQSYEDFYRDRLLPDLGAAGLELSLWELDRLAFLVYEEERFSERFPADNGSKRPKRRRRIVPTDIRALIREILARSGVELRLPPAWRVTIVVSEIERRIRAGEPAPRAAASVLSEHKLIS